ncbi:hypothetical protein BH11VER1_BH11VER1_03920 [soil metagenome]
MNTSLRFHLGVYLSILAVYPSFVFAADPDVTVRQVVIRAPELRVVNAMLANPDDEALAKILFEWVDEGTAKIVSQVSDLYGKDEAATVQSGKQIKKMSVVDQDFDQGILIPMRWEDVFVGTSLEAKVLSNRSYKNNPYVEAEWKAFFSPRDQENVPWPAWWIDLPKPTVNLFPMPDFYVEKVETTARFVSQGDVILGIMRQADQLELNPKRVKTLDIVVAQMNSFAKPTPSATIADVDQQPARSRLTVLGFGVNDHEALDLISRADLDHDKNLLDELFARVVAGKAILRTCSAVSQLSGRRARLESAREYSFPTEMHTFPSSWGSRSVGTILEADYTFPRSMRVALEHHPALPRLTEWRCALDSPALVMRQPQFIVQKIHSYLDFGDDGVVLLSVMRTPDYLQGIKDVIPGETLLLFAKLDETGTPPKPKPNPVKEAHESHIPVKTFCRMELEALVFEVPANEEAKWSLLPDGLDDDKRFTQLIARTKDGSAKLVAHVVGSGPRIEMATIEEVMTVVRVDRPAPGRYRPTGLNKIPCGTNWEAEAGIGVSNDPFDHGATEVRLTHQFQHHVAFPVQPEYQKMIEAAMKSGGMSVPQAVLLEETWEGEIKLKPGTPRFIGLKHPPGAAFKDKLHLAFVRVRVGK